MLGSASEFLRLSLELEALRRLAADAPEATASASEHVLRRQEAVADPATYDRFDALDREFHRVLYERSGNPGLWRVMRSRSTHLDRLRRLNLPMPGKMQALLRDHEAVVKAVRSGNVRGAAEEAMRKHLSGTLAIVDAISEQYPQFNRQEDALGWDRPTALEAYR